MTLVHGERDGQEDSAEPAVDEGTRADTQDVRARADEGNRYCTQNN
jgi:hypothetical protein